MPEDDELGVFKTLKIGNLSLNILNIKTFYFGIVTLTAEVQAYRRIGCVQLEAAFPTFAALWDGFLECIFCQLTKFWIHGFSREQKMRLFLKDLLETFQQLTSCFL